jgi:hypothetical protein
LALFTLDAQRVLSVFLGFVEHLVGLFDPVLDPPRVCGIDGQAQA